MAARRRRGAERVLGAAARRGRPAGHDRRRRHLQARRCAGRAERRGMSARPAGVERDYPLARLTTVRTGRARPTSSPARRARTSCVELLAWAERRGTRGRSGRLRLEPAGLGRWLPRAGHEAGRRARRDRARRRRTCVCGGGARLPSAAAKAAGWGLTGLEFGVNIPGHRRRRRADERQRLRRRARAGPRVGHGLHAPPGVERRAPGRPRLLLPRARTSAIGEVVVARVFGLEPRRPGRGQGHDGRHAAQRAARRSPPASRPSARPS